MNQSEIMTDLGVIAADTTRAVFLRSQAFQQYVAQGYRGQDRIEAEFNQDLGRNTRASSEKPYIPINSELTLNQLMSYPTATMYGSRALQVNHANSDYDIAFSSESCNIVSRLMAAGVKSSDPTNYFKVGPEGGYYAFFHKVPLAIDRDNPYGKRMYADILVVHTDEDLDCISSSINDLRSIPSYLLENKGTRIDLYQKALVHRGWKRLKTPSQVFMRPAEQLGPILSPFLLQEASEPNPWE